MALVIDLLYMHPSVMVAANELNLFSECAGLHGRICPTPESPERWAATCNKIDSTCVRLTNCWCECEVGSAAVVSIDGSDRS